MREGYSIKVIGLKMLYLTMAFMIAAFLAGLSLGSRYWLFGVVALVSAILVLCFEGKWIDEAFNHVKGRLGEIRTAAVLSSLPKEYWVKNDIVIGDSGNIDHLVVGPTGIWTIETKYVAGRVTVENDELFVNGYPKKWLSGCRFKALNLSKYIDKDGCENHWVNAMIVFSSDEAVVNVPPSICEKIGVDVVDLRALNATIQNARDAKPLSESQIKCIRAAIDRRPAAKL